MRSKKWKFYSYCALITLLAWFMTETVITVYVGLSDTAFKADYAVVLGSKVNEDGTLSKRLEARVEEGLRLYRDSLVRKIIVSGATGKEGHPEGTKMAEYLIQNGVPPEDVIVDDQGRTTYLTARNVSNLLSDQPAPSIIVVSQYFHLRRTESIHRKMGFKYVYRSHARYYEWRDLFALFREFFALYKYRFSY